MKTQLIFSFDTEDFTSCEAADAILAEAEILRRHGIRGCFCVVGLLAKQLKAWGRQDVIDALAHHEIASHSWGHTYHPLINEYTDIRDFSAAHDEVVRQETEALELLRETFSRERFFAACPPGNQKSYAAMYAYADMGIPIYADTVCDTPEGDGVHYCNVYHIDYTDAMESLFFHDCTDDELRAVLDRFAGRRHAVLYTHPHFAMYSVHWDVLNYDKVNLRPFGEWITAPRRPQHETDNFYRNLDRIAAMAKEDDRFVITTYGQIAAELEAQPARVIRREDLPAIRAHLQNGLYPFAHGASYSLYDLFHACRAFLRGAQEYVCEKSYGFLSTPMSASRIRQVTAEDLIFASENARAGAFLPEGLALEDGEIIGCADFLYAALDILCGAASAEIVPGQPQLPSLDRLPQTRDLALAGTWRHSDDFSDTYLSNRLRLQSWTMRFWAE